MDDHEEARAREQRWTSERKLRAQISSAVRDPSMGKGGQMTKDEVWREIDRMEPEREYAESLIAAVDDWLIANDDRGLHGDWREALRWVIERDGLPE